MRFLATKEGDTLLRTSLPCRCKLDMEEGYTDLHGPMTTDRCSWAGSSSPERIGVGDQLLRFNVQRVGEGSNGPKSWGSAASFKAGDRDPPDTGGFRQLLLSPKPSKAERPDFLSEVPITLLRVGHGHANQVIRCRYKTRTSRTCGSMITETSCHPCGERSTFPGLDAAGCRA